MKLIRKTLKCLLWLVAGVILFAGGYLLTEQLLSRSSVAEKLDGKPKTITGYLLSNGVHTDIVMPVVTSSKNWSGTFPYENTAGKDTAFNWIAIGWGDKGFYLHTPEWKDLTFSTAFTATFGLGATALHVTYYKTMQEGPLCKKMLLSEEQYQKMIRYVENSLDRDADNRPVCIVTTAQYGKTDAFYEAKGAYSMFHTCNTWTNNCLKAAGLKAAKWVAFDKGILYHYK